MAAGVARIARPGERRATAVGLAMLGLVVAATAVLVVKDRREAPLRYRIANPSLPPQTMTRPKSPLRALLDRDG